MDYWYFFKASVRNAFDASPAHGTFCEMRDEYELTELTSLVPCIYYDFDAKEERLAIVYVNEETGCYCKRYGLKKTDDVYFDFEQDEILTREELFKSWKEQLTEENQTFKDFLINATHKDGTLEKIY